MKYNRQFTIDNYTFNVGVELNVQAERHPNGKVWHKVTTNDMGPSNFYKTKVVESSELMKEVRRQHEQAKEYTQERKLIGITKEEKELIMSGFTKQ